MKILVRAGLLAFAVSFAVGSAFAADPAAAGSETMTPAQIDQHLNDPRHTDPSATLPDSASHPEMAMPAKSMHHARHHAKHHAKHHHHHAMKKAMPKSDDAMAPAAPTDDSGKGN